MNTRIERIMSMYASGEAIPLSTERGEFDSRHGRQVEGRLFGLSYGNR